MFNYIDWLNGYDFSMVGCASINKLMNFGLCLVFFGLFLIFSLFKLSSYYSVKEENDIYGLSVSNDNSNNNLFHLIFILLFICTFLMLLIPFKVSSMTCGEFVEVVDEYIVDFDDSINLEVYPGTYESEYILNGYSIGLKYNDSVTYVSDSALNRFESKIMENSYGYKKEFITIYYN